MKMTQEEREFAKQAMLVMMPKVLESITASKSYYMADTKSQRMMAVSSVGGMGVIAVESLRMLERAEDDVA